VISGFARARAAHLRLGAAGERAAARLLAAKGMDILARNYKRRRGEIDIVARDGAALVFVEVKTLRRKPGAELRPSENLSARQKKRIRNAALTWLSETDNPRVVTRFDFVEVIIGRRGLEEIRHWPAHFSSADIWRKPGQRMPAM
jgi:putative endonuclease